MHQLRLGDRLTVKEALNKGSPVLQPLGLWGAPEGRAGRGKVLGTEPEQGTSSRLSPAPRGRPLPEASGRDLGMKVPGSAWKYVRLLTSKEALVLDSSSFRDSYAQLCTDSVGGRAVSG